METYVDDSIYTAIDASETNIYDSISATEENFNTQIADVQTSVTDLDARIAQRINDFETEVKSTYLPLNGGYITGNLGIDGNVTLESLSNISVDGRIDVGGTSFFGSNVTISNSKLYISRKLGEEFRSIVITGDEIKADINKNGEATTEIRTSDFADPNKETSVVNLRYLNNTITEAGKNYLSLNDGGTIRSNVTFDNGTSVSSPSIYFSYINDNSGTPVKQSLRVYGTHRYNSNGVNYSSPYGMLGITGGLYISAPSYFSGQRISDVGNPINDQDVATKKYVDKSIKDMSTNMGTKSMEVTLLASSWNGNGPYTQTVSAPGVTVTNAVLSSAIPENWEAAGNAGVYCSGQALNRLTFSCTDKPETDLSYNILVIDTLTIIEAVPTMALPLRYTGSPQSPAWNNYDSTKMTLGGTTSATDVGSYNATFTPKDGYCWADGSTETITVVWKINASGGSGGSGQDQPPISPLG